MFSYVFSLLEKFIAPEFLIISFIFGYLIFFYIFYSTDPKSLWKNIRDLERFLLGFILGLCLVFLILFWISGISDFLCLLGYEKLSFGDISRWVFLVLFVISFISFLYHGGKKKVLVNIEQFCAKVLCYLFPIWITLIILTNLIPNRYAVYYRGVGELGGIKVALLLTLFSASILLSVMNQRSFSYVRYKLQSTYFRKKILIFLILTVIPMGLFLQFFMFPVVDIQRRTVEEDIVIYGDLYEDGSIEVYMYKTRDIVTKKITITPKAVNWLNIPLNLIKPKVGYFNNSLGVSNATIQGSNLSVEMKRFGKTSHILVSGRKEWYEAPRGRYKLPFKNESGYVIDIRPYNKTEDGYLDEIVNLVIVKNVEERLYVEAHIVYSNSYKECSCFTLNPESLSCDTDGRMIILEIDLPMEGQPKTETNFRLSCKSG